MRNKLYIIGGIVLGLVFTFFAIDDFSSASGDVDCGGETMSEGDTCMTFGEDGGVREAEEQRDAYQSSGRKNLLWAGGSFAGAGLLFYMDRRSARDDGESHELPTTAPPSPPPA